MSKVRRIYVEKKEAYAIAAKELRRELDKYLGITGLSKVRVLVRYDIENVSVILTWQPLTQYFQNHLLMSFMRIHLLKKTETEFFL